MFELTAQKIADQFRLGIPPGTDIPAHVADYMVGVGNTPATGPYVRVFLSEVAAEADTPIVLPVRSRPGWREAWRLARVIRPGGRMNGGGQIWPSVGVNLWVEG